MNKIWDAADHNAFTDLARFQGAWFCTFREAQGHIQGNGKIRLVRSLDGAKWESTALLEQEGVDLRDPKLSVTPDNRLMVLMGGSVYEGKTLRECRSRVTFSTNGTTWTAVQPVFRKDQWLWRVTWHEGRAYGIAYGTGPANKPGNWELELVSSPDGTSYETVTRFNLPGQPNEATLRFLPNGRCVALLRRDGDPGNKERDALIGTSSAPYRQWTWRSAGMQIGGPNFVVLPDGKWIAAGRQYGLGGAKTFVGTMTADSVEPELILPSGGDCSYPGMVWYEGMLWISYYSSQEGKTSIYLARMKRP